MNRPVILAAVRGFAFGVAAGYAARSVYRAAYARRTASLRRAIGDEDRLTDRAWLMKATGAIHGTLMPDETIQRVTVAVCGKQGDIATYTLRRGDAMVEATYGGKP